MSNATTIGKRQRDLATIEGLARNARQRAADAAARANAPRRRAERVALYLSQGERSMPPGDR